MPTRKNKRTSSRPVGRGKRNLLALPVRRGVGSSTMAFEQTAGLKRKWCEARGLVRAGLHLATC